MSQLKSSRIHSIDVLRGLVMVIMALDHVRDYFHINAMMGNYPENMDSTNGILFATRFVTHYCAPVFVFLAGTSAFLYGQNKRSPELSKFLITRGLWLIFVEVVIVNFLWWFDPTFGFINLQVIWAIGICMILLGLVIYLPKKIILGLGLLLVFGHNLLDGIQMEGQGILATLWYMLHQSQGIGLPGDRMMWFSYPVLPWIGIIFLGYCFGEFYKKEASKEYRKKFLLFAGIGAIAMFFVLRMTNIYGDPSPWQVYETTEKTIISFFNVAKYPPSLSFLLITLGPALLFLLLIENVKNKFTDFLLVFGRVPFFYYLLHLLFIHVGAVVGLVITGGNWKAMILTNEVWNSGLMNDYGYPLLATYAVWIALILILYPICKWYMNYKLANRNKWWLSYL